MSLTTLSMTKSHGQICLPEFCPLLTHILHIDTENNHKLHDKRNWSVQLTLKTPSMTKNHSQICLPEFSPLLTYIQHVDSENNHKLHTQKNPKNPRNCSVQFNLKTLSMTKSHNQIHLPEFHPLLTHIQHIDSAGIPWCTLGHYSVAATLVKGVEETVVGQWTPTVEGLGSLDHVEWSL